jgi:asparagine synthase (glutamine-hydrolysing)
VGGERCTERRWRAASGQDVHSNEHLEPLVAEARRLLSQSVRTRLIADVPVGVFLSGGMDSTLVALAAAEESSRRLQTFTIGYDVGSVNETIQARRTARFLDSEHHELTLTQAEVGERGAELLASVDQPLADRALLPLNALSEFARPRVTVALGGEGADELFGARAPPGSSRPCPIARPDRWERSHACSPPAPAWARGRLSDSPPGRCWNATSTG